MKYEIIHALVSLYPYLRFSMTDTNDLATLTMLDSNTMVLDYEALNTWVENKNAQEPMRLLRIERNRRLQESDAYALPDYPHASSDEQAKWLAYRKALRDLPLSSSPSLNTAYELEMSSVTWTRSPNDPLFPEPVHEPTPEPLPTDST